MAFAKRAGERRREISVIALGLVAVIALALWFYSHSHAQRRQRWMALSVASDRLQLAVQSESVDAGGSVDNAITALRELYTQYPDTLAGQTALALAADALLEQKRTEDAVRQYEALLDADLPSPEFRRRVLRSLAHANEQAGDYAAAARRYGAAARRQAGRSLAEDRWNEGRCLEQNGSKEAARKAYEAAVRASEKSLYAKLARSRLDALLRPPRAAEGDAPQDQPGEVSALPAEPSAAADQRPDATGAQEIPRSGSDHKEEKAPATR